MAVVRQTNLVAFENDLSQATLDWSHETISTGLDWYLFKHGVFHLLSQGQVEEAKQRMLDIHFMAEFAKAYETVVEPLKAFRLVGVEDMGRGFCDVGESLLNVEGVAIEDAIGCGKVAMLLRDAGLYDAGAVLEKIRYSVFERILGKEHPDTLTSINNLAVLYQYQDRYEEAEPLCIRVLEARERLLGKDHPRTLTLLHNLAVLYLDQHKTEGKPLFIRLLESWMDSTDWKHHWARLGLELSDALVSGDFTSAESVLKDLSQILGQNHDRVSKGQNKIDKARAYYQQNT